MISRTIDRICAHSMTRYGLCIICGAVVTPGMLEHISETYRAGDCPWCAYSEPDSIFQGSPVDWSCKAHRAPCETVRKYIEKDEDCKSYFPRKVEVKNAG